MSQTDTETGFGDLRIFPSKLEQDGGEHSTRALPLH